MHMSKGSGDDVGAPVHDVDDPFPRCRTGALQPPTPSFSAQLPGYPPIQPPTPIRAARRTIRWRTGAAPPDGQAAVIPDLPLPPTLQALVAEGRWPTTERDVRLQEYWRVISGEKVMALAPDQRMVVFQPPPFHRASETLTGEHMAWCPVAGLELELCLDIGDFGPGSDTPILLDYSIDRERPRLLRLAWEGARPTGWTELASSFDELADGLGLRELDWELYRNRGFTAKPAPLGRRLVDALLALAGVGLLVLGLSVSGALCRSTSFAAQGQLMMLTLIVVGAWLVLRSSMTRLDRNVGINFVGAAACGFSAWAAIGSHGAQGYVILIPFAYFAVQTVRHALRRRAALRTPQRRRRYPDAGQA